MRGVNEVEGNQVIKFDIKALYPTFAAQSGQENNQSMIFSEQHTIISAEVNHATDLMYSGHLKG